MFAAKNGSMAFHRISPGWWNIVAHYLIFVGNVISQPNLQTLDVDECSERLLPQTPNWALLGSSYEKR
mgnify:CR=1 FL=1